MPERKNPYLGWTRQRLEKHEKLINEALAAVRSEDSARILVRDQELDAYSFRLIHSKPECNVERYWLRDKQTFYGQVSVYELQCAAHAVRSEEFTIL